MSIHRLIFVLFSLNWFSLCKKIKNKIKNPLNIIVQVESIKIAYNFMSVHTHTHISLIAVAEAIFFCEMRQQRKGFLYVITKWTWLLPQKKNSRVKKATKKWERYAQNILQPFRPHSSSSHLVVADGDDDEI